MFTLKTKRSMRMIAAATAVGLLLTGVSLTMGQAGAAPATPDRPEGPCDIYKANGLPCWSAHSTTRALSKTWDGPLYQVYRFSDGKLKDIPVVQPSPGDAGGYADAAVQDTFCANTSCEIQRVYDQSGEGNDLYRAPMGGDETHAGALPGGNDNVPIADWAPVSIGGHKVYGIFSTNNMGLRNNDPSNVVMDDDPESIYWVIDGRHFASGCCYGYGNGEPDSRDNGNGTMEAMAFTISRNWHIGSGPGPWGMTDQENNLVGCIGNGLWQPVVGEDAPGLSAYDPPSYGYYWDGGNSNTAPAGAYSWRFCTTMPVVAWRWYAGFGDFDSKSVEHPEGFWANRGADLKSDYKKTYWESYRVKDSVTSTISSYNPMRKQGAIYFGTGGDDAISSQGTMYEGVMTHGMSTEAIDWAILDNIKAANYDEYRLTFVPVGKEAGFDNPLMTFGPGVSQKATVSWKNTTGQRAAVVLSVDAPGYSTSPAAKTFLTGVAPGETVSQVFTITGGAVESNNDLIATVDYLTSGADAVPASDIQIMHGRNTASIKINEYSISSTGNTTDNFIELYNSGASAVDISGWTMTYRPHQQASFSTITIPSGTLVAGGGFYTLGLSTSGLATPANAGDPNIKVRSVAGLTAGQTIQVGVGANAETATIQSVGTAMTTPGLATRIFQPLPPECNPKNCTAPEVKNSAITVYPAGLTNLPITSATGFVAGQQVQVGYGDNLEVLTVAAGGVGTVGAQRYLAPAINTTYNGLPPNQAPPLAVAGSTNIKVNNVTGFYPGMRLRLDIDDRYEVVTVVSVGTASHTGTGIDITPPLKFTHPNNTPIAVRGTGVTFTTPTQFDHLSAEPIRPLGTGVTLVAGLTKAHPVDDVVQVTSANVTNAGFSGIADQLYGGPSFITIGGSMVLRTAKGNIADSVNYGLVVDAVYGEGYMRMSPGFNGCLEGKVGNSGPAPGLHKSSGQGPFHRSPVV